jgi:6-phosphogluconolactonase
MEDHVLVYIGTYTEPILFGTGEIVDSKGQGIYVYRLRQSSGELSFSRIITGVRNPSYLAFSPDKRFLYAVNELKETDGSPGGAVSAFSLDAATGMLEFLNKRLTHGTDPCYVTVNRSGSHIFVANFMSGSVCVLPILEDGSLGEASDFIQHYGSSVDPKRQTGPHAHSVLFDEANSMAFVPDLGLDKVVAYTFDAQYGKLRFNEASSIAGRPGAGPRHITFHPTGKYAYLVNELDSSIDVFAYDRSASKLEQIQTISTLPKEFCGENTCADLHVAPSGQYVYASNRGHDSLVIYHVDQHTGTLACVDHVSTQGRTPRNFAIDRTGQFVLVANQDSDLVIAFRRDRPTGKLQPTGFSADVPTPVCVKILA